MMAKTDLKFNWSNWRNRYVWLNGKKIKLRHYISVNSKLMTQANKKGWQNVDHYFNYKIALSRYGLPGLKHYENRFYKNIPMPYNQTVYQQMYWRIANKIAQFKNWLKILIT